MEPTMKTAMAARKICGESQLQHDGVGAKIRRNGWKRGGDHRRVHVFHEQCRCYDERKQAGWSDHFDNPQNDKLFHFMQCCTPLNAHALMPKAHASTS
jgi:hypothetical protein